MSLYVLKYLLELGIGDWRIILYLPLQRLKII